MNRSLVRIWITHVHMETFSYHPCIVAQGHVSGIQWNISLQGVANHCKTTEILKLEKPVSQKND